MLNNEYKLPPFPSYRNPLQQKDLNKTLNQFPDIKKQSPYCTRVKEVNRRNSLFYQPELPPKPTALMLTGQTQRLNDKLKSAQPKRVSQKKAYRQLYVRSMNSRIEISPWETVSP